MKKILATQLKKRLTGVISLTLVAGLLLTGCGAAQTSQPAATTSSGNTSGNTIKVGILHSLSGTMAISEVSVKDAEMMAIDEINAAGGVLGKKIEPVVEDGASDWPTFAEKAKKLLQQDKVATVFGCWTSASRKAVLPVFEENNGLLWYPVQYEGMESSPNIFYTGAAPNQQIVPAVEWLFKNKGKKFFLLGSDYVFPRTANKIIKAQLKDLGGEVVDEEYTPLGFTDYSTIINKIKATKPDVVFNTLNGDSNVAFFKQLKDAGITSKDLTTLSVSVAEEEVRGIGAANMAGQLVSWNYYQTTDTPENKEFVKKYQAKYGADRVTDDPIEAAYDAVYLWAAAVKKAGSTDVDKVRQAAKGIEFQAPEGQVKIEGENQHLWKTVRIGEVAADGSIKEIWSTGKAVKPDPYLKSYPWAKGLSN
ncbi:MULTISPECIES: urea ABC transporter substrate-binding protein [Desulfosporosinus]|uniref:Aliphatic amidase expression-regulating protein n=1 Tax=Desulfosporosinus acididurans TaxID=476652 RepID=A0A0J1FRL2_9FIRM|nr:MULTISPECIES: urea ABC transporter substrate-binding protein [Desulfosporosinus]KLU65942.1 aliphatic amidase expression-regulating protein [Desulfosporosinus acididurans]